MYILQQSKLGTAILTALQLPYRPATTTLSMSSYRTLLTVLIKDFSMPFIGQLFDGYSLLLTEVK